MNSFPSLLESISDLNKIQIDGLLSLSNKFKHRESESHLFTYRRPIIATSFLENSTRTKHSFAIAIQKIGAMYIDFNAETSSLKKGENLEETFLTLFNQGVNLCIFRSSISHQLNQFKNSPPIKIINGGDGINEHPTQALLDLFTLLELSLDLEGKTIAILGDNIHSRVCHSLINLLPMFGMKIILCGPTSFLPDASTLPPGVQISTNRDETILKSDFIYLLRIQKERHLVSDSNEILSDDKIYHTQYGVSLELLKKINKLVPVLHPGPANIGVEIDLALLKSSLYKGYLQVQNSIPMRMAIIQSMLVNNDKNIGNVHGEEF
ncbi:MAG: aspartate carbamoyltransferase catalytic subunit [Bacteriovorax sp.]|nr:aspartate carbamoyltransferase catalytic subunit [Bacteriovorax sp.]